MEYVNTFFNSNSAAERKIETLKIFDKYNNERIPVIVDRVDKKAPMISRHKYLVPKSISMGEFAYVIRNKLVKNEDKLKPDEALFFFINNAIPNMTDMMGSLFARHKTEDEYLIVLYGIESTFGNTI